MGRSVKKGPFVQEALAKKVEAMAAKNEKRVIKTWSRASTVLPEFVGHTFAVHNGNKFIRVFVQEDMVGHTGQKAVDKKAPTPAAGTAAAPAAAAPASSSGPGQRGGR